MNVYPVTGRAIVVFCGRFPNEKADSLFARKEAEAFTKIGIETILLAPRRFGRLPLGKQAYRVIHLPTIDLIPLSFVGGLANYVNLLIFSAAVCTWLLVFARKGDFVLSNEPAVALFASFAMRDVLYEIHVAPERHRWFYRLVFRRALLALPVSEWNARFAERHGMPKERILLARSAVDTEVFREMDKREARKKLGLTENARIALYTGHLYPWKGADTLAEAARLLPQMRFVFVGGTTTDVVRFQNAYGSLANVQVVGSVPHDDIPTWQAAADVLVVPNSAKANISVHYTSPMKLFEYMASARPILASDLPSIREVLTEETGYFAIPDDARSFSDALKRIMADHDAAARRAAAARKVAEENTWQKRAARIIERLQQVSGH